MMAVAGGNICDARGITHHVLYPTSRVVPKFVLKDNTQAATPDETPEYKEPVPTA